MEAHTPSMMATAAPQASDLQSRTSSMMALKILILMPTIRSLEPQKFPSHQNAAFAMPA